MKLKIKRVYLFLCIVACLEILLLSFLFNDYEHDENSASIRSEDAAFDVNYLFDFLKNNHPNLYSKYDSASFEVLREKMLDNSQCCSTRFDFEYMLLKMSRFLDGHTRFSFQDLYKKKTGEYGFPYLIFSDKNIILREDTILSIAGIPSANIYSLIDSTVSWETHPLVGNDCKNANFNLLLTKVYNVSYPVKCQLLRNGNKIDTLISEISNIHRVERGDKVDYVLPYDSTFYSNDSIAIFYYNTCDYKSKMLELSNFVDFIYSFFDRVKNDNIRFLFIDVRQNTGGVGALNSYIYDRIHHSEDSFCFKISGKREGVRDFIKYAEKVFQSEQGGTTVSKEILRSGFTELTARLPAQEKGFQGEVFVLANERTYSAAADFCLLMKKFKLGKVVGAEVGQKFPYCGNIFYVRLPRTKIELQIPSTFTELQGVDLFLKDGFIQPDIFYPFDHVLELNDFKQIIKLDNNERGNVN